MTAHAPPLYTTTLLLLSAALCLPGCDEGADVEGLDDAEQLDGLDDAEDLDDLDAEAWGSTGEFDDEGQDDLPQPPSADDELRADPDAQAIEHDRYTEFATNTNWGEKTWLGWSNGRTCFLAGVTGELESAQYYPQASLRVYEESGSWWVTGKAGYTNYWGQGGRGVKARVACIPTANNRRWIHWGGNSSNGSGAAFSWVEDTGNTQCFLSGVRGTTGWLSSNSHARLRKQTMYWSTGPIDAWVLDGYLTQQTNGTSGGGASAVCVDMTQSESTFDVGGSSTSAAAIVAPQEDTACGMQGLTGGFGHHTSWDDGAYVAPGIWFGNEIWIANASPNKSIRGACYEGSIRGG